MIYSVELTDAAKEQLAVLPKKHQLQLVKALHRLENDPAVAPGVKKLEGIADLYRLRSGDYRALFTIFENRLLILVVKIGNRRDVYRAL